MSSLTVEEDQKWVPTHVQVTVLRGRGLRGKGKHGTSDVYTIIQLGKEKYSTGVAEKTTEPEWREECSFELQPGVLENGGRSSNSSSCPAGSNELVLTVMHRALIGMDVFLGKAVIQLDKVYHESRCVKNEWYRLNSKTGKKEKERGDIQVTVQFTRNNLTASMYDLVMKDKTASTFGKLKERMRGKRRSSDEDSSSAVLPGGYGTLCRMRQRLPSDGGGEEDYEDDEGGEARRSKMRTFFLRGKLRKSSDTRSSTSLGSESSESSSRGGSLSPTAGISVVVSDLSNSPSNSSNLTVDNSPEHTANTSPKSSSSLKCEFGDEAGEITIAVPPPPINRSHAHAVQPQDPGSGKPADSLGLGLLQKSLPLSMSLQNLSPLAPADLPKGPVGDGRRWSFDKPGEEEKAAIAAALEQSGPMVAEDEGEEEWLGQAAPPKAAAASSTVESESQRKKQRRNLFSHGRSESAKKGQSQSKDESEQAPAATAAAAEEKHRGWFGSKDSHSKPSLVVSPKLEPSTDPHPPPLPRSHHPSGPPVVSLHHSNPFCPSQSTPPPPISPCNPFFSLLQHNPFYEEMLTAQPLKASLPPLPYLSSSRPPITQLFPQSNPNPTLTHPNPTAEDSTGGKMAKAEKRPLPPTPTEVKPPLSKRLSNPFTSVGELEADSEWDESFEAFAAGRLQSPEDLTTDCKTQQNTPSGHPLEHCNNKGAILPITDAGQNAPHHQPCTDFAFEAQKATSQVTNTNMHHFDMFAQFLETIPEHTSFESENITLNPPTNSPELAACTETNEANSTTNTDDLTNTNLHQAPCDNSSVKLNRSSPDPGSSGLGSSAEEDFLSCVSSYSDKFSASSSEEAEAQNFESNILSFEKSSESAVVKNFKPSESEDDINDRSNDLSLVDVDQHTVIHDRDGDENVVSEGSLAPQSPVFTHQQPVIEAPKPSELQTKSHISLQSDNENGEKDAGEFSKSLEGFSKVLNDSSATPYDELCSTHPSLHIITSSPDLKQSLSDSPISLGGQDASQPSPIPFGLFGDFLNTSHIVNSPSRDNTLLHAQVSDQSTSSSFLQSLYVSTDSQDYQTCVSHPTSKCSSGSEPNETLHSANSTLCGELSEIQTTADAGLCQDDSISACKPTNEEIKQTDQGPEVNTTTLEPSFMIGKDSSLEVPSAASTDSYMSYNPRKLSEIQMTADGALGQEDSTSACKQSSEEISQTDQGSKVHTTTLEPSSMIEDGLEVLPVVSTDSYMSFHPRKLIEGGAESSEPNKTLHSVNSTLCGNLCESQTAADATLDREDSTDSCKPSNEEINQTDQGPNVSTSCMIRDGLEALPVAPTDSFMNCNPRKLFKGGVESPLVILGDADAALGQDSTPACKQSNEEINQTGQGPKVNTATLEPSCMIGDGLEVLPVALSLWKGGVESPAVIFGDSDVTLGHDSTPACKQSNDEINQIDQFEEFVCGAKNKKASLEPSVMIVDGLEALPAFMNFNPRKLTEGGVESQHVILSDLNNACKQTNEGINPAVQFEESLFGAEDNMSTLEPNFMIGEDFGSAMDSYVSCNQRKLTEEGVESQHVVLDDMFSKCPQAQSSALHRSQSEGTLIPLFDELLLPSFGSDPGAIQESSSAPPGPDHPSLTSFAPSLTPDSSSSPVALFSLPLLLANTTAKSSSATSTARAAVPKPLPQETWQLQQHQAANQQNSPHPVKPLTTAMLAEEKRTEGRSVLATGLEKLKSTIHPGRSSQLSEQETDRKKSLTEGAGSYYHLNHSELVALLVQREAELERQKAEFERQKCLLAKREVELKKLKPQVRDLEDYIDTLLVRIMEQKPTLLQVRSKLK